MYVLRGYKEYNIRISTFLETKYWIVAKDPLLDAKCKGESPSESTEEAQEGSFSTHSFTFTTSPALRAANMSIFICSNNDS
jgi:hypothetical protein